MNSDVFIDGIFVGNVADPSDFIENVKLLRRNNEIDGNINVYYDEDMDTVYMFTKEKRLRRPLIVVKNGKPLLNDRHIEQVKSGALTWDDLVSNGVIEYLDAAEEENALVAFEDEELTVDHTHLEINPMANLSLTTAKVPFGEFNQSARLLIGTKNQKQCVGLYSLNYPLRFDVDVHLMHYPQVPLVKGDVMDMINADVHPEGQNVTIAVMAYDGYNMEDAIIINKASVDRGLFRSSYFRPLSGSEVRYPGGFMDEIVLPDKDIKGYKTERQYSLLEGDGIIYPEATVVKGDVVIGKTSPPRFLNSDNDFNLTIIARRDSSISIKEGEEGIVDFVILTENLEGNKQVNVRIRQNKIPEIGDKLISRHGQKGVISRLVPQEDLPFSSNGTTPDLLVTPAGIPSRMTVSHIMEIMYGKTGALAGRYMNGSTFNSDSYDDVKKELHELGFRDDGSEVMFDGRNGNRYKTKIFVGNMYFLRLKHLVSNKIQARSIGTKELLTRQPVEGKNKGGGLRLGEMEKDAIVAHGASVLMHERFSSDEEEFVICTDCGSIGYYNRYKNVYQCPSCGNNTDMRKVRMAHAFKLFLQELEAIGVRPKIEIKDVFN